MDYFMIMGIKLFLPFLVANYMYPVHKLITDNAPRKYGDPDYDDNSLLVWVVFAFCVWFAHSSHKNNEAKWEVCGQLERFIGYDSMPEVCWDNEPDYSDDY